MNRQYPIQIYTTYKNQIPKMSFVQHDTEVNKIYFEMLDDINVPMTNIYEATGTVQRPDNKTYTYGMVDENNKPIFIIEDNFITFILPPSALYAAGECAASISLYDSDYGRLSTQTFKFTVTPELISDTPVDETNEYPVLSRLLVAARSEIDREASEDIRIASENTRIASENIRISSENTRIANENTRISSESTRAGNESTRITNENARIAIITAFETDITNGNTLKAALEADITSGTTLKNTLEGDITTGTTLKNTLEADITSGTTLKNTLEADITSGTTLKNTLEGDITTGNTLKTALETDMNGVNQVIKFQSVTAVSNTYTLDLSQSYNFAFETLDTANKTLAFSNIPVTANLLLSIAVKVKFTNNAAITYPASVIWQDAIVPSLTAGKQYFLTFASYDNGATWLGSYIGAW